ncbi:MAG: hypothetical protein Q9168_007433 [Polycauliona sp. 1 TL-2023]
MPEQSDHSGNPGSTEPNTLVKAQPKRITLPNPKVSRSIDEGIQIDSKTFSFVFDSHRYTWGQRLELREERSRNSEFNFPRRYAEETLDLKAERIRQFGSLIQHRKTDFEMLSGMEKFSEMIDTLGMVDHKLNALLAELGQLRCLTAGVLPDRYNTWGPAHGGDAPAFETLVERAADMGMKK